MTRDGTPYKVVVLAEYVRLRGDIHPRDLLNGARVKTIAERQADHLKLLSKLLSGKINDLKHSEHQRRLADLRNVWAPLGGGMLIGGLIVWALTAL
mgnify:FL=1